MTKTQLWAREMNQYIDRLAVERVRHSREWAPNITIGVGSTELQRIARRVEKLARIGRSTTIQAHKD